MIAALDRASLFLAISGDEVCCCCFCTLRFDRPNDITASARLGPTARPPVLAYLPGGFAV